MHTGSGLADVSDDEDDDEDDSEDDNEDQDDENTEEGEGEGDGEGEGKGEGGEEGVGQIASLLAEEPRSRDGTLYAATSYLLLTPHYLSFSHLLPLVCCQCSELRQLDEHRSFSAHRQRRAQ